MKKPAEISVIVPVLNEGESISEFLFHVRETTAGWPIEIIIVDGDPEGSTIKKIRDKCVISLLSPGGRGVQMNQGAAVAKGKIFLFLHADTRLPQNAFYYIKNALMNDTFAGGAFNIGFDGDSFLLRMTGFFASLKHRMTRVPYGDGAIFLRADLFREIGGYRTIPLFEDVDIMRRIKKRRKKIIILRQRVKASPRQMEKDGILFTIARNWMLQILFLLGVPPEFLVKYYYKKHQNKTRPQQNRKESDLSAE